MGRIAYEFRVEMSRALYDSYVSILASGECQTQVEAIDKARKSPAPHWFTSVQNASWILGRMYSGLPTGLKNRDKIRKFEGLYEAAEKYRAEHDEWPGLFRVCRYIVETPAPEFFICHNTAKQMILAERKRRREEVMKRWVK